VPPRPFLAQAMPVAIAAFFATRFSFAPVLRTTPFADLLVFFDEVPDFLRLALFMNASRSTRFVQLGSFYIQRQGPYARISARAANRNRPRDRGRRCVSSAHRPGRRWPKRQTPPSGREAALAGFAELVCSEPEQSKLDEGRLRQAHYRTQALTLSDTVQKPATQTFCAPIGNDAQV
jgi:hypothetical protein